MPVPILFLSPSPSPSICVCSMLLSLAGVTGVVWGRKCTSLEVTTDQPFQSWATFTCSTPTHWRGRDWTYVLRVVMEEEEGRTYDMQRRTYMHTYICAGSRNAAYRALRAYSISGGAPNIHFRRREFARMVEWPTRVWYWYDNCSYLVRMYAFIEGYMSVLTLTKFCGCMMSW